MKKEFAINNNWLFSQNFDSACLEAGYDFTPFYPISLPHNNILADESNFDESDQRALLTYTRVLTVPEAYNGSRLLLHFEGVLSYAEVYVNGTFVASHKGESPFDADITAPVKYDYENRIVLKVDASLSRKIPTAGIKGPDLAYGGIHRDVFFLVLDGRDIRDVYITTPLVNAEESVVKCKVSLFDFYPDTQVEAFVFAEDGTEIGRLAEKTVQGAEVLLKGSVTSVIPWTCETPMRYVLKTVLKSGSKTLDVRFSPFGFVTAAFRRDGFYLNGKALKLIGLCRYDSYPRVGRAMPSVGQRADARLLRYSLGCNTVRTMGIASKDFLDECSKIGLLVIEDLGGDGYIGDSDWRKAFVSGVSEMVRRDRNEPCIIAFGVRVDHSLDCDELYFKSERAAKEADPSRATFGARDRIKSRAFEDVFGFCDNGGKHGRNTGAKLFVPFMVAAHSGGALRARRYDSESVRLKQANAHLKAMSRAYTGGRQAGAIGLALSDFNAGTGLGSGDNMNYCGVTDRYRLFKTAAHAYASQGDEPYLALGGSLAPDEFDGALTVFTNCDSVKLYRNGRLAGEYFAANRLYPGLKHPPVIIRDFLGSIPKEDGIKGIKLSLLKRCVSATDKKGEQSFSFLDRVAAFLLRKLMGLRPEGVCALLEKYAVHPPKGCVYKIEGILGGEVVKTSEIGCTVQKTLRVECDCEKIPYEKSYELVRFAVFCEDGHGNILAGDFSPVHINATGSVALIGPENIALQGGAGGFYVRSLTAGAGRVTVKTEYGAKTFALEADYEAVEKF